MRSTVKILMAAIVVIGAVLLIPEGTSGASVTTILYVARTGSDLSNSCQVKVNPCATLNRAVAVARSGDTVEVAAGTYNENVVVSVPDLTVVGDGSSTVVTGTTDQTTFEVSGSNDSIKLMSISNSVGGGGIENGGNAVTIIDDNVYRNHGTGISNTGKNVMIAADSISRNGTGISNQGESLVIRNSSIFQNAPGGGISNSGIGAEIVGDTINWNALITLQESGGGIDSAGGSISVGSTILSDNESGQFSDDNNCVGPIVDSGYNLESSSEMSDCGFSKADHDVLTNASGLASPVSGWYGGPTPTVPIGAGSPAEDAIPASSPFCRGTDQRGTPRLQPGTSACDIGAFQSIGGYWEVAADGGIFAFHAPFYGSMGGQHLNAPMVGVAEDPTTRGYWEVGADGGIFSFHAPFYGSMGGQHLNARIVGIASDPVTGGYWEVAADGGIFSFNAPFYGSMGGRHLNAPIVAMAADPVTGGYWEVAANSNVFKFGGAQVNAFSTQHLTPPIVGLAANDDGGYWEVAADGGIKPNEGTQFKGSMAGHILSAPMVGMAGTPGAINYGYWEVAADGGIFSFGVPFRGSMGGQQLDAPIVGVSAG